MIPSKTYDVLGTALHQAFQVKPNDQYMLSGNDINELRALAMRFSYSFNDGDEMRDWQNRLVVMCDSAIRIEE